MDSYQLMHLGWILAANARIEGMKAANAACVVEGKPPTYTEDAFMAEAQELDKLARQVGGC